MPINYEQLMALKNLGQKYAYTDRDVMLYAYGIGLGADPMDENELAYVNEGTFTPRPLKVVPTFASVAAWGAGPGEMNLNRVMVVDGERDITFHKPLPSAANITADSTVLDVFDKGKDKGAVIRHQTVLKDENGEKLATLVASRFARGDGGFGGPSEGQPEPHKVPSTGPRQDRRHHDAAGPGAGLSPLRRPQPAALRSGICQEGRFPETDPARHVHLRHHLPRRAADLCRLRSVRLQAARRAVFLAGLSRRDRDDGAVEGRQRGFVRSQGEVAGRHRDQERQDGAGLKFARHSGARCSANRGTCAIPGAIDDSGSGPSDHPGMTASNKTGENTMGLLDGKVAIITGAGGGLGEAYAKLFAREGAAVVVNDLGGPRDGSGADVSMAQKVVNAIKDEGGRAVANGSDISTMAGGQSVFDDAIKNFGRADILVNNAGILLDETFAKAKEANWDRVIRVHLKGTFCCTQPVFKWMRENGGGVIVNTSSTSGLIGNFGQTNYGAAKGGIWGLSNVLAIEGRKYNIRIWTLAPGALTRMTADLPRYKENPGAALGPDGIAPAVLYMVSDLSGDQTGKVLGVSGPRGVREMRMMEMEGWTPPFTGWKAEDIVDPRQGNLLLRGGDQEVGAAI